MYIYIYIDDRMENMKLPYRYHKENYDINRTCPQKTDKYIQVLLYTKCDPSPGWLLGG